MTARVDNGAAPTVVIAFLLGAATGVVAAVPAHSQLAPVTDSVESDRPEARRDSVRINREGRIAMGAYHWAEHLYRTSGARLPSEWRAARARFESLYRRYFARLEAAHRKLPGDRWITGQRVFHATERRDFAQAQAVARACRAEQAWCASLVGYVSHLEGNFARADSAFAVARRTLSEHERCRWEDLTPLIDRDGKGWYEGLGCAERVAVNDTLWWLADPLYLFPGNERRSEHVLRHIYARLSRDFDETSPASWNFTMGLRHNSSGAVVRSDRMPSVGPRGEGRMPTGEAGSFPYPPCSTFTSRAGDVDPLEAMVLAKGIPSHISRLPGVCHTIIFPTPAYHFIPSLSAVRNPMRADAGAWNPEAPLPREAMHPRFGEFTGLDHQLAWFRRAGAARVVAALDLARNRVLQGAGGDGGGVVSGLALSAGPGDTARLYRTPITGRRDVFVVDAPADSILVSVEGFAPGSGAARARYASGPAPMPAQRFGLSDILLLDGSQGEDRDLGTLDDAARHAASNPRVPRNGAVGLFWEIYGLEADDSVSYALSTAEGRVASPVGRLGRALGMVAGDSASVQWTEHRGTSEAVSGRSIVLSVSGLPTGKHLIRLRARVRGQEPVSVSRWIEVVDP